MCAGRCNSFESSRQNVINLHSEGGGYSGEVETDHLVQPPLSRVSIYFVSSDNSWRFHVRRDGAVIQLDWDIPHLGLAASRCGWRQGYTAMSWITFCPVHSPRAGLDIIYQCFRSPPL